MIVWGFWAGSGRSICPRRINLMGILLGRVGRGRGRRGFERIIEGGCEDSRIERGSKRGSCYYFDIPGHMGGGMEILFLIMLFFDAQLTRVMW